jgi:hypothetical protein
MTSGSVRRQSPESASRTGGTVKKGTLRLLGLVMCLYVLTNLTLVLFAPILHEVRLEISVQDTTADLPLQGVIISWIETNPSTGFSWSNPVGTTDEKGRLKIDMTVQEQPLWVFPMIGWFQFNNRTLRLAKEGYDDKTLNLSRETPSTTYGTSHISIAVKMTPGRGSK